MLNFPTSPALNDEYTYSGTTYVWDGVKWVHEALTLAAVATSGSHADLLNRTATDSHSIAAITGLQSALDGKAATNAAASFLETVISSTGTGTALRVTQTGTGDALRIEDSANPDSTPFVIDASGFVTIGGADTPTTGGIAIKSTIAHGPQVLLYNSVADVSPPYFVLRKSRADAIVQTYDGTGVLAFQGHDGSVHRTSAQISSAVASTPGASSMPGLLLLSTTPTGSVTPAERIRIDSVGNVGIGTTAISARTHIVSTTEQLRIGYDATKYASMTVNSTGDLTIVPTGNLVFGTWTSNADAAVNGYITIKSADGTTRKLATIA